MGVWDFIQDQVLGMKWLNGLIGRGLSVLGLDVNGRIGGSVQFFIYDVLKITVLLCVLIFIISYIQSYFPPERSKRILGRFHGIWANIVSALLGTVTPFCSCSSIPLFIGFTSAGLPLGVTFSFLISSPMVDLGSLVLLISIFGAKVAIVYVILGLIIAVVGGTIIEKLRMEKYVESFVLSAGKVDIESPDLTKRERLTYAKEQMLSTFKKVFPYILIGVGIGALIHNWIPESWIVTVLGSNNHCHDSRHPHVCRYFWHNSRCGSTSFQGRSAGYGSVLYDGGYNPVAAFPDYASQGCKTQTAVAVHRNLCGWNYFSGLFI